MAGKYIPTVAEAGNISCGEWCKKYILPFSNDSTQWNAVASIPPTLTGIRFTNLRTQFDAKDNKQVSPTILGDVDVQLVEWDTAICAALAGDLPKYSGIVFRKDVNIPVARAIGPKARYVMQNIAIDWLTKFEFGIQPSDLGTCNLYMSAMHSVYVSLLDMEQTETAFKQKLFILFLLTQTAMSYFQLYPESKGPVQALVDDRKSTDMTQKAIAIELWNQFGHDDFDPKLNRLMMLEVALRRWQRHRKDKNASILTKEEFPKGIMSCLVTIPMIFATVRSLQPNHNIQSKIDSCYAEITKRFLHVMENVNIKSEKKEISTAITQNFLKYISFDVDASLAATFFAESVKSNDDTPLDYVKLGFIKRIELPIEVSTEGIVVGNVACSAPLVMPIYEKSNAAEKQQAKEDVKGKEEDAAAPPGGATVAVDAEPKRSITGVKIQTTNPSQWSGVQLPRNGKYIVSIQPIGGAVIATGSTQNKNATVTMRFTVGPNILPNIDGKAISGMQHNGATRKYVDTRNPLTVVPAFGIEITDTEFIVYHADGFKNEWHRQKRNGLDMVIGFKYCHFTIKLKAKENPGPFSQLFQSMSMTPQPEEA